MLAPGCSWNPDNPKRRFETESTRGIPLPLLGAGGTLVGLGLDPLGTSRNVAQPLLLVHRRRYRRRHRLWRNHWKCAEVVSGSPWACVGLTAGAYDIGTALTVSPIDKMIKASGHQHALVFWGIIQGVVVMAAALFLARPPVGWTATRMEGKGSPDQGPRA